jgi:hypothetical protein
MSTTAVVLALLGVVIVTYLVFALAAYVRMRGRHVVTCPETHLPAGVTVDQVHAAVSAMWDGRDVRLASCTRWPEREGCDQACAPQIAADATGTRADTIFKEWFEGKSCAMCRRPIPPVHAMEQRPALLDVQSGAILTWDEIAADQIPGALETHVPVCENCAVAETFRRRFPDRVVDRADTDKRDRAIH